MNRPFLLRPLSADELLELQRLMRAESTPASLYRRCTLVWELAAGFSIADAAAMSRMHYTNAHKWVKRFLAVGLDGLRSRQRSGRPRLYDKEVETAVIQAATSRPADLGLEFTTWSLVKLQQYLRRTLRFKKLSRETVRRVLSRHGLRFLTGQTWCKSADPDFEVKKTPS
jgi:transposase